ncbi:MAG TPA: hypothetical protein VH107_17480 [Lacipirellulaceae bacterium]|nr:hypothetical protein [Lacipirellulaceae bacterium]
MSEYLLTGITISIAASLVTGAWAGAVQGLNGIHSGRTLRTHAFAENVWVILVIAAEAPQVCFAYFTVGTKDFGLICVIFVLTIPSLGWLYSQSKTVVANIARNSQRPPDG